MKTTVWEVFVKDNDKIWLEIQTKSYLKALNVFNKLKVQYKYLAYTKVKKGDMEKFKGRRRLISEDTILFKAEDYNGRTLKDELK